MSVSPTSHGAAPAASPAVHGSAPRTIASPLLLPTAAVDANEPRRPSIQFSAHSNAALPRGSPKLSREKRRMSSPPPPPVFQPRVSFDTFDRPADFIEENSFTLITKHKDYEYTKRSRTFLCGCDDNEYSEYALQWLIDELVDDGDEIVCLRVVEKDDAVAADRSVEQGRYRSEAESLMKQIQNKNHENKAINLILEFAVGKVNKVIDEMINMYEPAILVVGTRGRSLGGFQGLLPGSVSKYCLQHSPVPVIVVRPSSKRDKSRHKRALDPSRHGYKDLLEKAGPNILDTDHSNYITEEDTFLPSDEEAAAVAAAIGVERKPPMSKRMKRRSLLSQESPLAKDKSWLNKPGLEHLRPRDPSPDPGAVMKSPELQNLDSPEMSEVSSSDEEDEGGVPTSSSADVAEERRKRNDGSAGLPSSDLAAINEANEKQDQRSVEET